MVASMSARELLIDVIRSQRVVDVGEVRVTKTTLGRSRAGERYLIYLPLSRNYLWRYLHESNAKIRVFIEIPELRRNNHESLEIKKD